MNSHAQPLLRTVLLTLITFVLGILFGAYLLDVLYPLPPAPVDLWDDVLALERKLESLESEYRFENDLLIGDVLQLQSTLTALPPTPTSRAIDLDDPLMELDAALEMLRVAEELLQRDLSSAPGEYNQLIVSAIGWVHEAQFQVGEARLDVYYADPIMAPRPTSTPGPYMETCEASRFQDYAVVIESEADMVEVGYWHALAARSLILCGKQFGEPWFEDQWQHLSNAIDALDIALSWMDGPDWIEHPIIPTELLATPKPEA